MVDIAAITNKGHVYTHNEDSYCINELALYDESFANVMDGILFAGVCDGVGGAARGDDFSRFCTRLLSKSYKRFFDSNETQILELIKSINEQSIIEFRGFESGSTLAGVIINQDAVKIINIGDSRVYRISHGIAMQYSVDDSLVIENKRSHALLNYLGNPHLNQNTIHLCDSTWLDEDLLLICSDGVSDYCDIDTIFEDGSTDIKEKLRNIEESIYVNGAKDNFTAILIKKRGEQDE